MKRASRGVHVYILAFAGTHCAYPQREGQAELTGWLVTYWDGLPTCKWSHIQALTRLSVV